MKLAEISSALPSEVIEELRLVCEDDDLLDRVLAVIEPVLEDERRRSEELRRSQATLQSLVDNFPGGIVSVFDTEMRHILVGGETTARLGFSTRDMIGKTPSEYRAGRGADVLEHNLRRTLMGEHVRSLEIDGTMSTLVLHTPVFDPDGSVIGAIVVGQDVTDLVTLQEERIEEERVRSRLEREVATSRARAIIIEQVLHEVRNPLAALSSSAEILERYDDRISTERRAGHLRRIFDEVRALQKTLSQLAQISD